MYHNASVVVTAVKSANAGLAFLLRNVVYHYVLEGSMPEHRGFPITQKSCFEPFVVKCGLESFEYFPSLKSEAPTFQVVLETLRVKYSRSMTSDFDADFEDKPACEQNANAVEGYISEELQALLKEYEMQEISIL